MLPPLPSTNWRSQSLRPTAQISFLMALASGVANKCGFGAGRPSAALRLAFLAGFWPVLLGLLTLLFTFIRVHYVSSGAAACQSGAAKTEPDRLRRDPGVLGRCCFGGVF